MSKLDEMLAAKLSRMERDALETCYRAEEGTLGIVETVDGEEHVDYIASKEVAEELVLKGLFYSPQYLRMDRDGVYVYSMTLRGKRVCRHLPEISGQPLETLYVQLRPNDFPEADPIWMKIERFDIVALEQCESRVDQFFMLQKHVPEGFTPVHITRTAPLGVHL